MLLREDSEIREFGTKLAKRLGATHYVGLNQENVASKYVKLCGSAEQNATKGSDNYFFAQSEENFFNTKKNENARKALY
jgi:hypothetical protein